MTAIGLSDDVASVLEAERVALGASSVMVLTVTVGGDALELVGSTAYDTDVVGSWAHVRLDAREPAVDVFRSGRPLVFSRWSEVLAVYPHLASSMVLGGSACAFVPMTVGTRPVGVWVAQLPDAHAFSAAEVDIMAGFASRWAGRFARLAGFAPFSVAPSAGPLAIDDVMAGGFERLLLPSAIATNDGELVAVNQRLCALVDGEHERLVGRRFVDLLDGDDRSAWIEAQQALAAGDQEVGVRIRLVRRSAPPVRCDVTLVALRHHTGAWLGTLLQVRETADEPDRLETIARALFEALPVGVAVFDLQQRFVALNPAMASFNSMSIAEHLGRPVTEVLVHPFALELSATLDRVALGESVRDVPLSGVRTASGDVRHYLASWIPIRERDGTVIATAAVIVDHTDRVRADEAEARRRSSLEAVVAAMPIPVAVVDGDGRYAVVNSATAGLGGIPPQDHVGRTVVEVYGPQIAATIESITARDTHEPAETTVTTTRSDGVRHDYRITGFPLPGEGWGYAVVDDTALHDARHRVEALARIAAGLSRAGTAHEMAEVVEDEVHAILGTSTAGTVVVEGDWCAFLSMRGYDEHTVEQWQRFGLHVDVPIARSVRTGLALWFERQADAVVEFPDTADDIVASGTHALGSIPIRTGNRIIGALLLAWDHDRTITPEERQWSVALADMLGQSLLRAQRTEEEHHIANVLQQSLLPQRLDTPPWLTAAAAYRSAGAGQVGGDTYDLVRCPTGELALVVADVCGHGIEIAGRAAAVRHALRAQLLARADPVAALEVAEAALQQLDPEGFELASAAIVVVGPPDAGTGTSRCTVTSAGHPRPVVVRGPDRSGDRGDAALVESEGALLGLGPTSRRTTAFEIAVGDVLVVYTDGLTDTPRPRLDDGQLLELVRAQRAPVADLPRRLLDATDDPRRETVDDTAVVVLALVDPTADPRP